jgi:ketosteroid isomerase-like protein
MPSNVELLRDLFSRFNETGEIDLDAVDPEIEMHSRTDLPDRRVWRGYAGMGEFFAEIAQQFHPIRWEPYEMVATGPHVVVRARVTAYGASSGTRIVADEAQLWTFRDGRLLRVQGFPTVVDAYATARTLDEAADSATADGG